MSSAHEKWINANPGEETNQAWQEICELVKEYRDSGYISRLDLEAFPSIAELPIKSVFEHPPRRGV